MFYYSFVVLELSLFSPCFSLLIYSISKTIIKHEKIFSTNYSASNDCCYRYFPNRQILGCKQ